MLCGSLSPGVVDGGDGLQVWRVAANIYSISRGQTTRGVPPAWGLGEGLTTLHRKKKPVTKCYTGPRTLWALVNTVMNLRVA
jgi:hypothetical protein